MSVTMTIVTPSFNQADFLEETIRSVLIQRDEIHEYFLLDGGSSDGSVEIIKQYEDRIDWWVSKKDDGQSDALAKGFYRATGDVLGWINSDDILLPGCIEQVRSIFSQRPEIDIVTGYLLFIDGKSRILLLPRVLSGNNLLGKYGLVQVCQQSTFFRRELYERVGGLDISLHCAMDFDLWARFYQVGARWYNLPSYLAGFRKHGEAKGAGNSWWDLYQKEKAEVRDRYPELFGRPKVTRLALLSYQILQLIGGAKIRSVIDTARWCGKDVIAKFG